MESGQRDPRDDAAANRWKSEPYPDYREDVNRSISFAGLEVDFFLERKADHLKGLIAEHMPGDAPVCLDIGCGLGAMHPFLKGSVGQLHGIDPSEQAIREAARANPWVSYTRFDGRVLPIADNSVDVTFTSCVLHHVAPHDWRHFIGEARRVLRRDGLFVIFEHNPYNPLTRLAVLRCEFDRDAVLLTRRKTEGLVRAAGFAMIRGQYIFVVPWRASWVKRIERLIGALPLGAQYYVTGIRT